MNHFLNYLFNEVDDPSIVLQKILLSVALVVGSYFLSSAIHRLIDHYFGEKSWVQLSLHVTRTITIFFVFYLALRIWFDGSLTVALIFFSIIVFLGLALRDLVLDIVGYIYISMRHPFDVGDYIELKGITGKVVDLDFMQINLQEAGKSLEAFRSSGRYVSIPNRIIFEEPSFNFTHGHRFVMQEVNILIGFEADRQKALRCAGQVAYKQHQKILEKYSEEDLEDFDRVLEGSEENKDPEIRAMLDSNGFRIYIRYFSAFEHLELHRRLMENALYDEFIKEEIPMPEPTYIRVAES